MLDPYNNYVVDLFCRIDTKYDSLIDQVRRVEMELKTIQEIIKSMEDKRRSYQKMILYVLIRCLSFRTNEKILRRE